MDTIIKDFKPSKNRGKKLLREVLDLIEKEVASAGKALNSQVTEAAGWKQRRWGELDLTDAEVETATPFEDGYAKINAAVAYQSCGTTGCVAGHTAMLVGDSPLVWHDYILEGKLVDWERVVPVDGENKGEATWASERAAELLGLDGSDADILFEASNSIADVRKYITRLLNDKPITQCWDCDQYDDECTCDEED